jgi:hypothetical protein
MNDLRPKLCHVFPFGSSPFKFLAGSQRGNGLAVTLSPPVAPTSAKIRSERSLAKVGSSRFLSMFVTTTSPLYIASAWQNGRVEQVLGIRKHAAGLRTSGSGIIHPSDSSSVSSNLTLASPPPQSWYSAQPASSQLHRASSTASGVAAPNGCISGNNF